MDQTKGMAVKALNGASLNNEYILLSNQHGTGVRPFFQVTENQMDFNNINYFFFLQLCRNLKRINQHISQCSKVI